MSESRRNGSASVDGIAWEESPVESPGQWVQILTPKSGQKLSVIVLSEKLTGVNTHFVDGRTIPCRRLPECDLCRHRYPKRWKGYVVGILDNGQIVACELSTYACRRCPELLDKKVNLRGGILKVTRAVGKPNNPLRAEFVEWGEDMRHKREKLPTVCDIRKLLWRCWTGGH